MDKCFETVQVVLTVPNRSARQAPLGFASEVIRDLVTNRFAIANFVCLIEENTSPLRIQQFATITAFIGQKCVVCSHHNTIGTNILRTTRRGIRLAEASLEEARVASQA